jgi:hypothetical protein
MMTRKVFLSYPNVALFVLAFAVGLFMQGISAPARTSAASANQNVIHVIEHYTNYTTIDNGVIGDSPGDLLVFSNALFDATDHVQVGTESGSCIRTVVGVAYECNWTVFLRNGQITVEGPSYDHSDSMLAIIGGTGTYKTVRGQMLLHSRNLAGTEYDYIYYLS